MFTVKLVKYVSHSDSAPSVISDMSFYEAESIHKCEEDDGRTVLQLGDAPGPTKEFTVGGRSDCQYNTVFIMNSSGKTIEKIL
jgi:hypothetical protein